MKPRRPPRKPRRRKQRSRPSARPAARAPEQLLERYAARVSRTVAAPDFAGTPYFAPESFVEPLVRELGDASAMRERLVFAPGPPRDVVWAQNVWLEPRLVAIASIRDGVRALRAIQRDWVLYSTSHHRRARLIAAELPRVRDEPLEFGAKRARTAQELGAWTLLDAKLLLHSPRCSSPYPHGEIRFVEDKAGPPNRAYLKLWEAFERIGRAPEAGERCVDLGASPGGWTWALAALGAQVTSVDRAPLDPAVANLPKVVALRESAFGVDPQALGPIDWLFADIACYPRRLLGLVQRWLDAGTCARFVCTVKFQGRTDFGAIAAFRAIPGSRLVHLCQNGHELTWWKL